MTSFSNLISFALLLCLSSCCPSLAKSRYAGHEAGHGGFIRDLRASQHQSTSTAEQQGSNTGLNAAPLNCQIDKCGAKLVVKGQGLFSVNVTQQEVSYHGYEIKLASSAADSACSSETCEEYAALAEQPSFVFTVVPVEKDNKANAASKVVLTRADTGEQLAAASLSKVHKSKPWIPKDLVSFACSDILIWVSIDRKNYELQFGFGYPLVANQVLAWGPGESKAAQPLRTMINALDQVQNTVTNDPEKFAVSSLPVVVTPPPALVAEEDNTLEILADNSAIVPQSLDEVGQYLYGNVGGKSITISKDDAHKIDLCLKTPGCFLNTKLQEKSGEFGKTSVCMAYIRVTIGPDLGNSPGSPFVMEIWPSHCRSPIHDHSNAVAVIKVLYGSIRSTWFNPLAQKNNSEPVPLGVATFTAGSTTYLTPRLWQTHQLYNPGDEACVTIQTYQYPTSDTTHYETFDYVNGTTNAGDRLHFIPNSDYSYTELMQRIRALELHVDTVTGTRSIASIPFHWGA